MNRCVRGFWIALAVLYPLIAPAVIGAQVNRTPDIATTVPDDWQDGVYPPCGFFKQDGVDGRNSVLKEQVCKSDDQLNRPPGFTNSKYNFQGEKFLEDMAGTNSPNNMIVSYDEFIQASWVSDASQQVQTGFSLDMQTVAVDDASLNSPGIYFSNVSGTGTFVVMTSTGLTLNVVAPVNYSQWNTLAIETFGNVYEMFVNGSLAYTDVADPSRTRLASVSITSEDFNPGASILLVHQGAAPSDIEYTGETTNTPDLVVATPEFPSGVLFATGLVGLVPVVRRRKKAL